MTIIQLQPNEVRKFAANHVLYLCDELFDASQHKEEPGFLNYICQGLVAGIKETLTCGDEVNRLVICMYLHSYYYPYHKCLFVFL